MLQSTEVTFPPGEEPDFLDVEAELCRRSYEDFVRIAWPNMPRLSSAESALKWNWHHSAVAEHLQAVAHGQIRDLLINMPPGCLKTELTGVFFLPWVWTWRPSYKQVAASIVQKNATETSQFCRQVIESEWYQRLFVRGWELRDDKNAKDDFGNTLGGSRFATSRDGTVIGKRGDVIVGDDLQKDNETQGQWDQAWQYWTGTLSSRSVNPATVAKVLVQQRLGKRDISGRVLEHGGVVHLCLPAEYDPRRSCVTVVAGKEFWRDPRTQEGELLNPWCQPLEVAIDNNERAKSYAHGAGPVKYRAQFNQDPGDDEGGEIKRSYWRFHRDPRYPGTSRPVGCVTAEEYPATRLPESLAKILSADTAVKEKETNDWSVIGTVGYKAVMVYLLDLDRARTDIVGLVRMLTRAVERTPDARQKYVEDKSSGQQLLQLMRCGGQIGEVKFTPIPGLIAVDPGNVGKVERTRIHLLPRVEAGQVSLPEGAPWTEAFVAECAAFPNGDHDDQIDMLSQACSKIPGAGSDLAFAVAMGQLR